MRKRGRTDAKPVVTPSEAQIQETCSSFLELDGWRALQTDPVSDRSRGKGFGEVGMADHLYVRYECRTQINVKARLFYAQAKAEVLWIEWKRIKGKKATKPTTHQLDWHQAERARGALTLIAGIDFPASIEGFMDWYVESGLRRKVILPAREALAGMRPR